jgi:hypothetical protein
LGRMRFSGGTCQNQNGGDIIAQATLRLGGDFRIIKGFLRRRLEMMGALRITAEGDRYRRWRERKVN